MELVRHFDAEIFQRALEDWAWLLGDRPLRPLATSPFGDVFLQEPMASGSWTCWRAP